MNISVLVCNFESAHKHFLMVHLLISKPVDFISHVSAAENTNSHIYRKLLKPYSNSHFSFVLRNRTLLHCVTFILMKELHERSALNRWEQGDRDSDVELEKYYYLSATSHCVRYNNVSQSNKHFEKERVKLDKLKSFRPSYVSLPSSENNSLNYESLRASTIQYLVDFLDAQKQILWEREGFKSHFRQDRKNIVVYSQKLEEYYLILTLVRNACEINLLDKQLFKGHIDETSLNRLLDTSVLRYSKQIANRANVEAYRNKVVTQKDLTFEMWQTHDKGWIRDLEQNLKKADSISAILELYCLKTWNIKMVLKQHCDDIDHYKKNEPSSSNDLECKIHALELAVKMEQKSRLQEQLQHNISEFEALSTKHRLKLRALDNCILHTDEVIPPDLVPISLR